MCEVILQSYPGMSGWKRGGACVTLTLPVSSSGWPSREGAVLAAVVTALLSGRGRAAGVHCCSLPCTFLFSLFCGFREGNTVLGGGWAFVCFHTSHYLTINSFSLPIMFFGFFFFQKEVEIDFHKKILSKEFFSSYVRIGLSSQVNPSLLRKKNSILNYPFWFFAVSVLSKTFPLVVY